MKTSSLILLALQLVFIPPCCYPVFNRKLKYSASKRFGGALIAVFIMDIQETQRLVSEYLQDLANLFHRVPGSAIFLRYVRSSYQDDPIRSAVELFLFLFAVRYLLAPKYSTKPGVVPLSEDEIDDLVDEWTPEPLVGEQSNLESMEVDKRTVITG